MNLKGIPESRGKTVYQQIQAGKAVCASAAIVAKCFECMSGYEFTDSVTGSTVMGVDANHVRQRIKETRKAFAEAEKAA